MFQSVKNPNFPYNEYSSFDLDNMSEDECKAELRFVKNDLPVLAEALQIPPFKYFTRKWKKMASRGTNHGSGRVNYDFITLDLSEAPYWPTDLNSGILGKAHTNLSVQEWEVKVKQAGSLCSYNALTDEMHDTQ